MGNESGGGGGWLIVLVVLGTLSVVEILLELTIVVGLGR